MLGLQDLLAMELRSTHKDLPYPDRVIVHRKGVPGNEEEEHLAHELRCYPNTAQVCSVYPEPNSSCQDYHSQGQRMAVVGAFLTGMLERAHVQNRQFFRVQLDQT